jgi:hypothetical protein
MKFGVIRWRSRRRGGSILGITCVASACLAAPAPALAGSSVNNAAATRVYIRADEAFWLTAYPEVGARIAAIEARESEVAGQCPSALTYAPRDAAFQELGEEMGAVEWYAGVVPMRQTLLRLARAIDGLSWSNHRLTRLVRSEVAEERADAMLILPEVCSEIEAWKASAYATLPPSAGMFLEHLNAIESGSVIGPSGERREAIIFHLLAPYEGPAERKLSTRIERIEAQASKRVEAAAAASRQKLAAAMGVSEL